MPETAELSLFDLIQQRRNIAPPAEKHVLFRLGSTTFCLPAQTVRGVMGARGIIPARNAEFSVIGFAFSQSKALPVVDIRQHLNIPAGALTGKEEILLVNLPSDPRFRVGILVELLENAREIPHGAIQNAPNPSIPQAFLRGCASLDGTAVWAIDLDFILTSAILRRLSTIS